MKKIYLGISIFVILFIFFVAAEEKSILNVVKENSKGITIEAHSDGGFKATVSEENGEIVLPNKKFSGLALGSSGEFDKDGNEKKLNLKTLEKQMYDFGGIETLLPQESEIKYDGWRYDVSLKKGSKMETGIERNEYYKDAKLNFHSDGEVIMKDGKKDFTFQSGIVSHDGKNYFFEKQFIGDDLLFLSRNDQRNDVFFGRSSDSLNPNIFIDKNVNGDVFARASGSSTLASAEIHIQPTNKAFTLNIHERFAIKAGKNGEVSVRTRSLETGIFQQVNPEIVTRGNFGIINGPDRYFNGVDSKGSESVFRQRLKDGDDFSTIRLSMINHDAKGNEIGRDSFNGAGAKIVTDNRNHIARIRKDLSGGDFVMPLGRRDEKLLFTTSALGNMFTNPLRASDRRYGAVPLDLYQTPIYNKPAKIPEPPTTPSDNAGPLTVGTLLREQEVAKNRWLIDTVVKWKDPQLYNEYFSGNSANYGQSIEQLLGRIQRSPEFQKNKAGGRTTVFDLLRKYETSGDSNEQALFRKYIVNQGIDLNQYDRLLR